MNIAFTICSNNYLAQAKILGDSFLEFHPDWKFIIGLCDELSEEIDYSFFEHIKIIPVADIAIYCFNEIKEKYDIIELNTSIKPSFFKYLISRYENLELIIYLDPDIQIFRKISLIEKYLEVDDILLTPHILNPIGVDDLSPSENLFLNYGIYNLGFLALNSKSKNVLELLDWWEEKTLKIGYNRVSEGLFVDQLWINLVPIFFKKVKVLFDYGCNVAPWNLHERQLHSNAENKYVMMDETALYFYHFSSYNYKNPTVLSKYYNRYSAADASPIVLALYKQYQEKLIDNKVAFFSNICCSFIKQPVVAVIPLKQKASLNITDFIPPIAIVILRKLKNVF